MKQRIFSTYLGLNMKTFREKCLKVNLTKMCRDLKIPVTTLYNFENGKSTNINNIIYYQEYCKNDVTKLNVLKEFVNLGYIIDMEK